MVSIGVRELWDESSFVVVGSFGFGDAGIVTVVKLFVFGGLIRIGSGFPALDAPPGPEMIEVLPSLGRVGIIVPVCVDQELVGLVVPVFVVPVFVLPVFTVLVEVG